MLRARVDKLQEDLDACRNGRQIAANAHKHQIELLGKKHEDDVERLEKMIADQREHFVGLLAQQRTEFIQLLANQREEATELMTAMLPLLPEGHDALKERVRNFINNNPQQQQP